MEMMMAKFDEVVGSLESLRHQVPNNSAHIPQPMHNERSNAPHLDDLMVSNGAQITLIEDDQGDGNEESEENEETDSEPPANIQDHVMTRDSYGKLRYVGGTGTMVLIEALKTLSPEAGIGNTPPTPVDLQHPEINTSILELPFFDRGRTWPPLPFLPKAEQLIRPPRYVSDLLVNLYFDQLHFTMPVIYKQYFMQRYNAFANDRSGKTLDTGFLSVFFAVCACASGLLPREPGYTGMFTGLQYYESALLLHYKSTGEGSIEQVQCLALLSMCTAGWNTLTQSWKFAGQAVRAAQDLGLHVSLSPNRI
jgi:Fungal specific transcription factor domain